MKDKYKEISLNINFIQHLVFHIKLIILSFCLLWDLFLEDEFATLVRSLGLIRLVFSRSIWV